MLETHVKANLSRDVLRFANLAYLAHFATKKDLTIEQIADVIAFDRDDVTKELMEGPFVRKAALGNKFGPASRFSNGDWPVFYTAIGRETAEKESSYHYGRKAAGDARPVHYSVVRCMFSGETIDLQPKLAHWPDLVSDDYKFCNELGRAASAMSLGGFLGPSARNPGGTTVPVFLAGTLSKPVIEATARLSYGTGTTAVEFKTLP